MSQNVTNNVVAVTDGTGAITEEILWVHQPLARKINGSWYYYIYNAHGDVAGLVNEAGTVVNTYEYTPWGEIRNETETVDNPIKYAREYYDDELDMIYLRARYYDPSIGRFITEDPARDGLNWYVYCRNNPIKYVDPTGYITQAEIDKYKSGQMAPMAYSHLMNLTYQWYLADDQASKAKYHQWAKDFRANDYKTTNGVFPDVDAGIEYMQKLPYAPLNEEQHYFRNELNIQFEWKDFQKLQKRLPSDMEWNGNVLANEHQNKLYNNQPNKKYVSACGSFEVIYNANNELQTQYNNWQDMGTFNYMSPIDYWFDHLIYDLWPYYQYDNVTNSARR